MGRSNSTYEKRRKELEKKKKKEAKQVAKAERKAAKEARADAPEPIIMLDEFGNVVEIHPEVPHTEDAAEAETEAQSAEGD